MRKFFIVLTLALFLMYPGFAKAEQKRNIFASWFSVSTTATTITLPVEVIADITVINGGSYDVFIDLYGGSIGSDCVDTGVTLTPSITAIPNGEQLTLYDFVTSGISMKTSDATASPISVIVTY